MAEVACKRMVPAEMERLPVKLESDPKVRSVPAATALDAVLESQSVFPMMLVMTAPLGTLVPETVMPGESPRVELTTSMLELAVPAERVVTVPPATAICGA